MSTGISQSTQQAAGFPFDEVNNVFRKRCRIYFCTGAFISGDTKLPGTRAANLALIGTGGEFKPLGMMDAQIGVIKPKRNNIRTDFYTIPTDTGISYELNNLRVYPDMVDWLDTDEAKGELTLLFVPDGDDGRTFLALNGVGITPEGEIKLNGELAVIKIVGEKQANDITDAILFYYIIPVITVTADLDPFTTTEGSPSASQNYSITSSLADENVTVTAPTGFEVSLDDATFAASVSVTKNTTDTIYIRLKGTTAGTFTGNVTHVSGETTENLAVSGTVSEA